LSLHFHPQNEMSHSLSKSTLFNKNLNNMPQDKYNKPNDNNNNKMKENQMNDNNLIKIDKSNPD